ncbi:MAG: SDR family NAD(P)-dependent oxidoreductase, partial [Candidatus Thorarchaeota archaeon]
NKVVLITGGASGIGRASAIRLAKEGNNIILNGRTESKLIETEKMLKKFQIKILIKAGDVSDSDFVSSMISEIIGELKQLHVVINNAGIGGKGDSILDIPEDEMQKVMDINFKGAWLVSKYAARVMKTQSNLKPLRGKIINISSIAGLDPMPGIGIYSCSKAALIALTKILAKELAPVITANAICPGYHLTPMYKNDPNLIQNFWNAINMKPLLKRVGMAEDVVGIISYLVSDDSDYMTGQIISICGGVVLH